jgi:hypothetical protein
VIQVLDYGSGKRIVPLLCERSLPEWCSDVVFSSQGLMAKTTSKSIFIYREWDVWAALQCQ